METKKIINNSIAGLFSAITIGVLTLLTYKTDYGLFLVASFGSTMVLLYGYPESPFAHPKNIFFGHLVTATVGVIALTFIPLPEYVLIPIAVGLGVFFMIMFNVTHPPAGGNPIIVLVGGYSFEFIITPIITGCLLIIIQAFIINNYILKRKYKIWIYIIFAPCI